MPRPVYSMLSRAVRSGSWFLSSHPVIAAGLAASIVLLALALYQAVTQAPPVHAPRLPRTTEAAGGDQVQNAAASATGSATEPNSIETNEIPLATSQAASVVFTDTGIRLQGGGALAWGDYDNDGDLDLVLAGRLNNQPQTAVFRNQDGEFVRVDLELPAAWNAAVVWIDYDHDGRLDLTLAGQTPAGPISKLYRNDGAAFVEAPANFVGAGFSALAWGDYDDDAKPDLALMGSNHARIYSNQNGTFSQIQAPLVGGQFGAMAWGDYDRDGDLDLFTAGEYNTGTAIEPFLRLLRNDGEGEFALVETGLPPLANADVAWCDFDGDGDLDLAVTGFGSAGEPVSRIYRNHGNGQFTDIGAALARVGGGSLAWGDMDNDGAPDLVVSGFYYPRGVQVPECRTDLYRNEGDGVFSKVNVDLIGVQYGTVAWGDYDNDGDLDLAVSGVTAEYQPITRIYRNEAATPNTPPQPPGSLVSVVDGDEVTFQWDPGSDAETPVEGLFYHLRIGTQPGRDDVHSPMADPASGWRRVPELTGARQQLSWTVRGLSNPPYYWSVQSIDAGLAGSAWAPEAEVVWARVHNSTRDTRHMTIQDAVDAAQDEDVIVLVPGLYFGTGNWEIEMGGGLPAGQTRRLTIRGADPLNPDTVAATVIDCQALPPRTPRRAFLFQGGEDRNTVVAGLTIRNAYAPQSTGQPEGGAIACLNSGPTIRNCVFQNCGSAGSGGAISISGSLYSPSPVIQECTFTGNRADEYGGAIWVSRSGATIQRCAFKGNSARYGGALCADGQGAVQGIEALDCVFDANYGTQSGGGIQVKPGADFRAVHCTLANNVAQTGGGAYVEAGVAPVFINTVVWGNRDSSGQDEYSQLQADVLLISNSHVQGWTGNRPGLSVSGKDPLFEDLDGADDDFTTWADNDLRLQRKSPCVNAAQPAVYNYSPQTDVQGLPRLQSCQPDIGAYESPWSFPPADYNRDCRVDLTDLRYLVMCTNGAGVPQTDPSCSEADLDLDGDVDVTDFAILQRCWSGPNARPDPGCVD